MRICKIWDADYPWDIRVEKIVCSLVAAGHTVDLVCRNQARQQRYERDGNFAIHRLPAFPSTPQAVHTLCNFPYPVNPVWITAIEQVIRQTRAELIFVRDILLALPAAILGKIHRIPVILDMAEHYPAMLQDRLDYTPTNWLGRWVRHPLPVQCIERMVIRLVDHIIVVVEESRARLLRAGVPPARLTIVGNTPRLDRWQQQEKAYPWSTSSQNLHLVYLGNLDGSRGLDVAVQAVGYLKNRGMCVQLSIIGAGPYAQALHDLVTSLGLAAQVTLSGRLPFTQVQTIMARSHAGLIPHYATAAWNATIPNKLFDYMLLGLPVIVSDAAPTARIVSRAECGEVFHDRDVVDLARCIVALTAPEVREQQGRRGQEAIYKQYNWATDAATLLHTIEAIGASHP
jgi:glycosyltransferase involved in cell wall biosynthesis